MAKKFRYKLWLRAHVHVGWLQQRLFQARTGLTANILRLPFATASACWLKTTNVTVLRNTNEIYIRSKRSLYPPEKTLSRQRSFEEGYNELSNEAISLALTCIA